MLAIFLISSFTTNAAIVAKHDIYVQAENKFGKSMGDLMAILNDWDCNSTANVSYKEEMLDFRGDSKLVTQKSNSSFNFYTSASVAMNFERNYMNSNPQLDVSISETCSKYTTKMVEIRDEDYNLVGYDTKTVLDKQVFMRWNCLLDKNDLPSRKGGQRQINCAVNNSSSSFMGIDIDTIALSAMKDKDVSILVSTDRAQEDYAWSNCNGSNSENIFEISVLQGLAGHVGENDFILSITLDNDNQNKITLGKDQITSFKGDAYIAAQLEYCAPEGATSVSIASQAIEDDLIFDDVYTTTKSLNLARGKTGVVEHVRKRWFKKNEESSYVKFSIEE